MIKVPELKLGFDSDTTVMLSLGEASSFVLQLPPHRMEQHLSLFISVIWLIYLDCNLAEEMLVPVQHLPCKPVLYVPPPNRFYLGLLITGLY